jgi:hypothetical protein
LSEFKDACDKKFTKSFGFIYFEKKNGLMNKKSC